MNDPDAGIFFTTSLIHLYLVCLWRSAYQMIYKRENHSVISFCFSLLTLYSLLMRRKREIESCLCFPVCPLLLCSSIPFGLQPVLEFESKFFISSKSQQWSEKSLSLPYASTQETLYLSGSVKCMIIKMLEAYSRVWPSPSRVIIKSFVVK